MSGPTLGNPKNTIEILQKYNFSFQKKFGQNFLIDTHVLDKIIRAADITREDLVLEIGPGIGTMTQYLAEAAGKVIAVEIDDNLIPILADTLGGYENVQVIHDDVLKLDIRELAERENGGKPIKIVANLPYYITTPIIMGLFESHVPMESITVMVQKEVADRMQSGPGKKDYGALSLAVQYYASPYIVANVPPNCFMPRPKVGSAVIRLTRYKQPPVAVKNEKLLFQIIRASFNQRRKTLVNGLANSGQIPLTKEQIAEGILTLGKGAGVRGEALTLEEFAKLADYFQDQIQREPIFGSPALDVFHLRRCRSASFNAESSENRIAVLIVCHRACFCFRNRLNVAFTPGKSNLLNIVHTCMTVLYTVLDQVFDKICRHM